MIPVSTTDAKFLDTLEIWGRSNQEILVLARFSHAAGKKEFQFCSSFDELKKLIGKLPPLTSVIAFRQPQLKLRGIVDDPFIASCLTNIPDGAEYLIVEREQRIAGRRSWFHHDAGESHGTLREDLEESRGVQVAVGLYPPWLVDTDDVISAIVPDENGVVRSGIY
jgi:hypothetical protein